MNSIIEVLEKIEAPMSGDWWFAFLGVLFVAVVLASAAHRRSRKNNVPDKK